MGNERRKPPSSPTPEKKNPHESVLRKRRSRTREVEDERQTRPTLRESAPTLAEIQSFGDSVPAPPMPTKDTDVDDLLELSLSLDRDDG